MSLRLILRISRKVEKSCMQKTIPDTARYFVLAVVGLICAPVTAQAPSQLELAQGQSQSAAAPGVIDKANQSIRADTDSGVITNQTITVAGQDFFQYFVVAWREKQASEHYTLSIHERPSARWGSEIWIEFAHRRVFRTYLPPARASIRFISAEAAEITFQRVLQADLQNKLIHDADLGRDEL